MITHDVIIGEAGMIAGDGNGGADLDLDVCQIGLALREYLVVLVIRNLIYHLCTACSGQACTWGKNFFQFFCNAIATRV